MVDEAKVTPLFGNEPPVELNCIEVRGAREHNLKNLDLEIPKRKLVVFTGPSGSGKSSLAFDTLFAEGQRRYVESLSAYARQFLGQMEKPEYDHIRGLSPTISIEQKAASNNPRSTVGTITEIYDYLRVLYARVGKQYCYQCGAPVGAMDSASIVDHVLSLDDGTRFMVLAPLVENRKGEFRDLFAELRREGFARIRLDGRIRELAEFDKLDKNFRYTIDVVIDRLKMKASLRPRLTDSIETALRVGEGRCVVSVVGGEQEGDRLYSENLACDTCGIAFPPLSPPSFSFNSPLGMCQECNGLGTRLQMDASKAIEPELSLDNGAIKPWRRRFTRTQRLRWKVVAALTADFGATMRQPWHTLPERLREILVDGSGKETFSLLLPGRKRPATFAFQGLLATLMERFHNSESDNIREYMAGFLSEAPCEVCHGERLRLGSGAVRIADLGISALNQLTIREAYEWFEQLQLTGSDAVIAEELHKEIQSRLRFLINVGLDYLTLHRPGPSLSGGEAQRIRLASQLGSELTGVLYILDEPSIGLHQRDNRKLLATLKHLRDLGNSVLVVEHDRETMEECDWILDFGPGAGHLGGEIVAQGTPAELSADPNSLTGKYLRDELCIEVPAKRRAPERGHVTVINARANNLKGVDVGFPIGLFTCVTGVSGAGKSTLVNEILYPALSRHIYSSKRSVGAHDHIEGLEHFDKVIDIDQAPIGRTPRSNPATYTKVFDQVRTLFAKLPEAKMYGYLPGRFSFNVKGGRCEACKGAGVRKIEMHFLPDVYVCCEQCDGKRFNQATLRVKFRGYTIADLLEMAVDDAFELFQNHRTIRRVLKTLIDVGLGYIKLGQPSPTLSGGEAQRIKLSRELAKVATGDTVYILDEPSTGLHFDDIRKLLKVVQALVEAGNTVIMIEHNLDIIKTADHIVDIGPEGGYGGGTVVVAGSPEVVAQHPKSYTGRYLGPLLEIASRKARARA